MNTRLSEQHIRNTCRELIATQGHVSGRQLRAELRSRFGAVGKTKRIFAIWREEMKISGMPALVMSRAAAPAEFAELRRLLAAAESAAAANLVRAERAEYREQAHQEKWAVEIDRLRQELMVERGKRLL